MSCLACRTPAPRLLWETVEKWLRKGGWTPETPVTAVDLANALLGPSSVKMPDPYHQPMGYAALAEVKGRHYIFIRRDISKAQGRWGVYHELGHWVAEQEGWDSHDEYLADAIGALLQSPLMFGSKGEPIRDPVVSWTVPRGAQ